jgi:hypothetical protein
MVTAVGLCKEEIGEGELKWWASERCGRFYQVSPRSEPLTSPDGNRSEEESKYSASLKISWVVEWIRINISNL